MHVAGVTTWCSKQQLTSPEMGLSCCEALHEVLYDKN
jgi:hypothetical protein